MGEQAHVKLSGDINGRYIVTDQRAGGELTLVPDTSWGPSWTAQAAGR